MKLKTGLVAYLITVMLLGCSAGSSNQLSGKFQGPVGTMEFLPEWQAKVDFNEEYTWLIEWAPKGKNHATYHYRFTDAKGQTVSMDKAERINFSINNEYVHSIRIKAEPGRITILERRLEEKGVMTKL